MEIKLTELNRLAEEFVLASADPWEQDARQHMIAEFIAFIVKSKK